MYYPYGELYRQDASRIMTVNGDASFSVEPDTVSIQLEVVTKSERLNQAQQENTHIMNQVIEALVQEGISRENIKTSAYNINPSYDYVDGKQVFRGYQVTNIITLKMKNIDQAGRMIDLAVKNGVNRVSNIQFTIENQQQYYQRALNNALKNAFAKAQTIAETLNVNFDSIPLKIIEETIETPQTFQTFAAMEDSMSTPIEPGQIIIRAKVEAQFRY
ncbi:SIMPL domain-containing protein [Tuberibacillus sp. Marseille-P3662]|uniref:SIMPL domain-containing protein n=1 Tax=Tuberibacillus sp. Marseille-P3662 TaxID=1965358 RepID=UPI000A1CE4C0|nr:SIMPL domain-containing protein [Tuberibacillus sp. Marseille-P3662]